MPQKTAKAAQHGDAGDLRNKAHSGRGDCSEHNRTNNMPQARVEGLL